MAKLGDLFPDDLQQKTPASKTLAARPRGIAAPAQAAPATRRGERVCVKDMVSGQEIEGIYLVGEATLRVAKNGSKYIQATLCDKTGSAPVRQWDANENDFKCYKSSGFVNVRGRVETYKNAMQMIVFAVQVCDGVGLCTADFLPVSTRPMEEMAAEFDKLVETFKDADYKALIQTIFTEAGVREKFLKGPAAASVHHAWIGGLVEHVLSACRTAQAIAEQRPFLNRDLLMAGVILHDIGKTEEIDSGPGFNYTDSGRLCGHIVLGALMVERAIGKLPSFPKAKRDLILHMILSHHGELEYGSPIKPYTAEAVALHHLECLDAKVQGIQTIIEKENASGNDGAWSEFARVVDGRIFKGKV